MLYPIERYLALHELIEIYAPEAAARFGLDMSAARMQREGVNLLLQAQTSAYQNNQLEDATSIAEALVGYYFAAGDFEAARPFADQYLQLIRERESPSVLARALGMLSTIDYQRGNAETAHTIAEQAFSLLGKSDQQRSLGGFLLCHLATIAAYLGKYASTSDYLEQAEAWFINTGNDLGRAWRQHVQARDYLRDQGDYQTALDNLIAVLPILEERTSSQAIIENLLATTDCLSQLGEVERAHERLERLESLVVHGKRHWYLSELLMIKGKVALASGDPQTAARFLRDGIGAVSLSGDIRLLSPLYRLLGIALSGDPDWRAEASDAFERGIACARAIARKLDLAWALYAMGQFVKQSATRPTEQARSSGYLFEGHKLFMEMGIKPPPL